MRILMLGWEFPPFISGGLGTACYGLTRGLDRLGHEVLFVLPRAVDKSHTSHVRLLSPNAPRPSAPEEKGAAPAEAAAAPQRSGSAAAAAEMLRALRPDAAPEPGALVVKKADAGTRRTRIIAAPSPLHSTYPGGQWSPVGDAGEHGGIAGPGASGTPGSRAIEAYMSGDSDDMTIEEEAQLLGLSVESLEHVSARDPTDHYSGDLFLEAARYARTTLRLTAGESFDVIHAHDWLTYPAGMTIARATGKPLVVHVHATEFDRSGEHVNQRVYDIERRGMHAAIRVICVSEFTKRRVTARYGVDPTRVRVVYNGIETEGVQPIPGVEIEAKDKIVLFLGRITMQKGPEYFIQAAKRVLEKLPNVKFLVAGSGDMATRMIELAAEMGIANKVLFTGFLRGRDVARVYEMADLYVMPSVSEPFGIAPLEAIHHGTPVLISHQSGVAEVLTHALKVDFWDVEDMANKIVAVLKHSPLHSTLRDHGRMEIRKLTWEDAGEKCAQVYAQAIEEMQRV